MLKRGIHTFSFAVLTIICGYSQFIEEPDKNEIIQMKIEQELDSLFHYSTLAYLQPDAFKLKKSDIINFARTYNIEPAAVFAVLDIEAGKNHNGFSEPCLPLINFDTKIFQRKLVKSGANITALRKKYPEVFAAPDVKKYGTVQRAEHAQLSQAREIDDQLAVESTFWGMFQIGGFNWRRCGSSDVDEFVNDMSRSERDQLTLFGKFLENTGMLDSVKNKQWSTFARAYNGPRYKSRGYDARLLKAYQKHKKNNDGDN